MSHADLRRSAFGGGDFVNSTFELHGDNPIFQVFAKNARLTHTDRFAELRLELHDVEWDVVLFSETRFANGPTNVMDPHVLFASGDRSPCAGVAILLHARHKRHVKSVQFISERLMYLDLRTCRGLMRIVAIYAPHAGYPKEELTDLYHQMHLVLEDAQRHSMVCVIWGGFNANGTLVGVANF